MKKPLYLAGFAALAAIAIIPFNGSPLLAKALDAGTSLAENILNKPKVALQLTADKQHVQKDAQSKDQVSWEPLSGSKAEVKPGDVLRYTLKGDNQGTRPAKALAIVQPIPQGTVYVLNSASVNRQGANVTYSIDNGTSYVAKPTVKITLANGQIEEHPAPAEAYTHIRLSLGSELAPQSAVQANYQVKVRQ